MTESGNLLTGAYSQTAGVAGTVSLHQVSTRGLNSTTVDLAESRQASRTESGNSFSGAFTKTVQESVSATLTQSGSDLAGQFTLSQTSADSNTLTETGNSVTGDYTLSTLGSQTYTIDQTHDAGPAEFYSLHETGTKTSTGTQTGSTITGEYSLSQTGSDSYTLSQSGTLDVLTYTETLIGQESFSLSETGNSTNGGFSRALTGSGSASKEETVTIAGTPVSTTSTVAPNWSLSESGNYVSGSISLTQTGLDRYGLLEQFHNTSNAAATSAPGILDYSPIGAVYFVGDFPAAPTGGGSYPARQMPGAAQQDPYAQQALDLLHEYCFAAGTLVLTDQGPRPIETLQVGEMVLSVPDTDPDSVPTWQPIAQVYHNAPARLLNIHVGDLVIRTTQNHPFYVRGMGWIAAARLNIGDDLWTSDGRWTPVTDLFDNGDVEPVFNFQVDGYRTYFLTDIRASTTVLVHNESAVAGRYDVSTVEQIPGAIRFSSPTGEYVAIRNNSLDGQRLNWLLFEKKSDYHAPADEPGSVQGRGSYNIKRYTHTPDEKYYELSGVLPGSVGLEAVKQHTQLPLEAQGNAAIAGALTFGLHIVPGGGAIDEATQGNWGEAGISIAGDLTLLIGGVGKVMQTAKAGTKMANAGIVVSRVGTGLNIAIDGGVGAYRTGQAIQNFRNGENLEACGQLGEASLRLLGLTPEAIDALRVVNAYAKSPEAKALLADFATVYKEIRAAQKSGTRSVYLGSVAGGLQGAADEGVNVSRALVGTVKHLQNKRAAARKAAEAAESIGSVTTDLANQVHLEVDSLNRPIRAEGIIVGSHRGRGKGYRPEPTGGRMPGDHRGHLIPENGVANPADVNVKPNMIAEAQRSNLSPKKVFENQAIALADANPGSTVRIISRPKYRGTSLRPYEVEHSVTMNGKHVNTIVIPNK